MKNLLMFGISDFTEVLFETISTDNPEINVSGFVLDDAYYNEEFFCGRPVYKYSQLKEKFSPDDVEILICIGYGQMNKVREKIFYRIQQDGWKIASYISKTATVRTKDFGIGNIIYDNVHIGVKCKIGDGNIFYTGAALAHHSTMGNFNFFATRVSTAGHVIIGNRCFFGNNCCTKDNVTIADAALIGAGVYVSGDILNPNSVIVAPKMRKIDMTSDDMAPYLMVKRGGAADCSTRQCKYLIILMLLRKFFSKIGKLNQSGFK